jgi:hypothetical protein
LPAASDLTQGSSVTVALSAVHVVIDEPDATLGYYRDARRLGVHSDVVRGGHSWITLHANGQPDVGIMMSQPLAGRSHEAEDALADPISDGGRRRDSLRRSRGDVRQARYGDRCRDGQEPIRQPSGARDIVVLDPAGIVLLMVQG